MALLYWMVVMQVYNTAGFPVTSSSRSFFDYLFSVSSSISLINRNILYCKKKSITITIAALLLVLIIITLNKSSLPIFKKEFF